MFKVPCPGEVKFVVHAEKGRKDNAGEREFDK